MRNEGKTMLFLLLDNVGCTLTVGVETQLHIIAMFCIDHVRLLCSVMSVTEY